MTTSAYQQSVSPHRRSGTGSDQLSKSMLAGDPRHRNSVTHPEPAGTDTGTDAGAPEAAPATAPAAAPAAVFAAAQNASVPGSPESPNLAKVFSIRDPHSIDQRTKDSFA
jgi:hypothetical protein